MPPPRVRPHQEPRGSRARVLARQCLAPGSWESTPPFCASAPLSGEQMGSNSCSAPWGRGLRCLGIRAHSPLPGRSTSTDTQRLPGRTQGEPRGERGPGGCRPWTQIPEIAPNSCHSSPPLRADCATLSASESPLIHAACTPVRGCYRLFY